LESLPRLEGLFDWLFGLPFSALNHSLLVVRHTSESSLFDRKLSAGGVFAALINFVGLVIEGFGQHSQVNSVLFAKLFFAIDLVKFILHIGQSDEDLTLIYGIDQKFERRLIITSRQISHEILVEGHRIQLLCGLA